MGQVCGLYQVDQSTVVVKEKFGKFSTVLSPGYHCVPWCCGVNVVGVLSLRIQQLDVQCETKSKLCGLVYEGCFLMMFLSRRMTLQRMWKKNLRRSIFFIPF
ncbi:hypothetical protein CY35_03G124800 [Sphagnum magellanicum]|nr:hypothetical protein CY35_03G124800 [Sphagnum magellanicum]